MALRLYNMIDNFIYFYHTDTLIVVPAYVDSVNDSVSPNYSSSSPLGRSAPIFSYSGTGKRTIQASWNLHRELMKQINYGVSNVKVSPTKDYVDIMIKQIQAAALPDYETASKMINPPIVAMRLGNDVFIKGVVDGPVGVTYKYPILSDGRYASVSISVCVSEMDPYSAKQVLDIGSYRGLTTDLQRRVWK